MCQSSQRPVRSCPWQSFGSKPHSWEAGKDTRPEHNRLHRLWHRPSGEERERELETQFQSLKLVFLSLLSFAYLEIVVAGVGVVIWSALSQVVLVVFALVEPVVDQVSDVTLETDANVLTGETGLLV